MATKKIRIGVIGCSSVSNVYLPSLSKSVYAELVSACDILPGVAKIAAEKYNIPNYYEDVNQMLNGTPFDLMVNLTNMQEHGRINKLAIEKGIHVWSEKPLANNYTEGAELLEFAKSKGVHIWGAPAVIRSRQFAFMAKVINEGKIGIPSAAHGHYGHVGPEWSSFWYEPGGGSMPDLGVYNLATLTALLGPARSVVAITSIVTKQRVTPNKGKIDVVAEDNAMVLMEHDNGTISHMQCGFNYFDPYGHEGKGQQKPSISIYGTDGNMHMIGYDWAPAGIELATRENPKAEIFVSEPDDFHWGEGAAAVVEFLATGKDPLVTPEHSLHVLEIIDAARESQATGKRIPLKSVFNWPIIK
jgi:predicted dehydrogenase